MNQNVVNLSQSLVKLIMETDYLSQIRRLESLKRVYKTTKAYTLVPFKVAESPW